jgi:antimicrobial peptide system SdpB family protein
MLSKLGKLTIRWMGARSPWTNVYGIARSILGISGALVLLATPPDVLFYVSQGGPMRIGVGRFGLFCLLANHLLLARFLAIAVFALVASGWRPRLTGLAHWYVAFSLQSSARLLEGGDHIHAILALLLVPVTLGDRRTWHWQNALPPQTGLLDGCMRFAAFTGLALVRLQVAGLYFDAAVGKMAVRQWADGTALYYWWIAQPSFAAPAWLELLLRPVLLSRAVAIVTWSVIVFELLLSAGLVMRHRYRRPLLIVGIGFHAMIAVFHGLPTFAATMVAALILYLYPTNGRFELSGRLAHARRAASALTSRLHQTIGQAGPAINCRGTQR